MRFLDLMPITDNMALGADWLHFGVDDDGLNFEAPEDQFRANNYFKLDYTLGKFTAGVQYETYLPSALLGLGLSIIALKKAPCLPIICLTLPMNVLVDLSLVLL